MSNGAIAGASAGATAAAAIAEAIKASGVIVKMEPDAFLTILSKSENPLVVMAKGGLFGSSYKYLTSYKGLAFFAKTSTPLEFSNKIELINAGKIWIPG